MEPHPVSEIRVLIVDDNAIDVRLITRMLNRSGRQCAITVAKNGVEALQLYQQWSSSTDSDVVDWPPALVLLDINMPIMGGFEFLQSLQKLNLPYLKQQLYILSSSNANIDREKLADNPLAAGYLVKPVKKEDLNSILETIQ